MLDRDGELGEVAVADDPAELAFGFGMPAAVQRRAISPDCQRLTLRLVRRTHSIIDSHGLVDSSVRFSEPLIPGRVSVSVSASPDHTLHRNPVYRRAKA